MSICLDPRGMASGLVSIRQFSGWHHLTFGVTWLLCPRNHLPPCVHLTFKNVVLFHLIISSGSFPFIIILAQVKMNKLYNVCIPEWTRKGETIGFLSWIPDTKYNSLRSWNALVQHQATDTMPFTCELGSLLEMSDSSVSGKSKHPTEWFSAPFFVLRPNKVRHNFSKRAPSWFQVKETCRCNEIVLQFWGKSWPSEFAPPECHFEAFGAT